MLIDSHAHLDFPQLYGDLEAVLKRAQEAGVEYILTVGLLSAESPNIEKTLKIVSGRPNLFYSVGIHPHDAKDANKNLWNELERLLKTGAPAAVGEAGLDFHYDHSPRDIQKKVFRYQVELAIEYELPLIVHTREATEETIEILSDYKDTPLCGVFHCFTGDEEEAKKLMAFENFYFSFPGVITFPKAEALRGAAAVIPQGRALIETDCPYLAPIPFRGKSNEPSYIRHTAEKLAELWGVTAEDVGRITSTNFARLFGVGPTVDTAIAYQIRNSLYLNMTNRCTLACTFCEKRRDYTVKGHYLKLRKEPTTGEILKAMGEASKYSEIVFCGYGEPTIRLKELKELAEAIRRDYPAMKIRINTDGLMNLRESRNALSELRRLVDILSVSLNAPDAATYARICPSKHGERAYGAVKEFIALAKTMGFDVTATAVDLPGLDVEAIRKVAEEELKVKFRLRAYNVMG